MLISPEAKSLVMDSVTGRFEAGGSRITRRVNAKIKCKKCSHEIPRSSKFCPNCGEKQLQISEVITENTVLENITLTPDSSLVTFATLRDLERTTSAKDVVGGSGTSNPSVSVSSALPTLRMAGIEDVMLIQDFPLTTAAIGFSRLRSGPPAWLNSFPATKTTGTKIPVYTNCITSEAWMVKLCGRQIIRWLQSNSLLSEDYLKDTNFSSEEEATIWLVHRLSSETKSDDDRLLYEWIYSLLHSYSHLTLQLLGINSGLDASSLGEMLLTEALSYIIYAGESDIGGLSATFNQGLGLVADDIPDFARVCKFDPSCQKDDSGVCVGCLYTSRGCVNFNNDLSRSFLYGGQIMQNELKQNIK
ncbi:zinc ribbon domain-containing protein, partial [Candidatus Saccharibacteria bacterium]|nr:zinc ribbon domain-containing protein [Candidatus Saccharibacteria bacterium]